MLFSGDPEEVTFSDLYRLIEVYRGVLETARDPCLRGHDLIGRQSLGSGRPASPCMSAKACPRSPRRLLQPLGWIMYIATPSPPACSADEIETRGSSDGTKLQTPTSTRSVEQRCGGLRTVF